MEELIKNQIKKLEDIKSIYIIKQVLSFLYEKQKLNMIIYNKHLQKIMKVDIDYFKKISGKYKICERNEICKVFELDTNKLIFEGEYKNGKKMEKEKNIIIMAMIKTN